MIAEQPQYIEYIWQPALIFAVGVRPFAMFAQ